MKCPLIIAVLCSLTMVHRQLPQENGANLPRSAAGGTACWKFAVLHSGGALRPNRGAGGMLGLAQQEAKQDIVMIYKMSSVTLQMYLPYDFEVISWGQKKPEFSASQTKWFIKIWYLILLQI